MKLILISIALMLGTNALSQDSSTPAATLQKLKQGIFADYDEFINNKPSITAPFKVVPIYVTRQFDDPVVDSLFRGYTYEFSDSVLKKIKAFGFFDGKQLYVSTKRGLSIRKQGFYPVSYIGRFSFIHLNSKTPLTVMSLGLLGILDQAISAKREMIFYYNKSGDFLEAKPETIGFLLKKDKDFLKEYNSEKRINNETYIKYLLKMNERYPL